MPNTCSVYGCKTNYRGHPRATVFRLPKGPPELKDKWITALHRDMSGDLSENNIFICIIHFREEDIVRVDRTLQGDGTYTEVPRITPTYRPNAIPVIFQGCPSHFTSAAQTSKRFSRESKEEENFAKGLHDSIIQEQQDSLRFAFDIFEDLKIKLPDLHLSPDRATWYLSSNTLQILQLKLLDRSVEIQSTLTINSDLKVSAVRCQHQVPLHLNRITDLRHIESLIDDIINFEPNPEIFDSSLVLVNIKEAAATLKSSVTILENSEQAEQCEQEHSSISLLPFLQFIICQLENSLLSQKGRRYNIVTQVIALKAHLISPASYRFFQSLDCLILPTTKSIRTLSSCIGLDSEYLHLLEKLTADFCERDRHVVLNMDEIHVSSAISYQGGHVIGETDPTTPTKKAFAMMISSLSKKWSQVVRLLPSNFSTAEELYPMVNSVINDIEKCDLFVEVLVTDNYPLNVRLFKLYSSDHKTLLPAVPHPTCPWRKLYLLFDFVHIIKSIRNNWLNLKDYDLSFTYPDMQLFSSLPISNSTTELNTAKFNDIRVLYKIEQHSTIKQAHRLSSKVCWPTSLERQNVNLALRIFNDSTCAALKIQNDLYPDSINDTSNFVDVMSKIWKIFNINTPLKHVRLNDEYSRPLADKDWRFVFLDSVCKWLERWSSTSRKDGKLSAQTFVSFRHSCITLTLITSHLTQNCGFDYVLSSRLQNDPIEHQFGIYRMMSGAQYHITYSQILESPRRLNLSNILKLFSLQQCKSELTLKQFINTFSLTANEPIHISYDQYFEVIHDLDSINLDIQVLQSIVFIGGYAVFSYLKTTNCHICVLKLTENKDIEISETTKYDLVRYIDRGSLKSLSDIVIGSIIVLWKIFTKIDENETLKKQFYFSPSRKVLIHLAENVLVQRYSEHWRNDCDSCSTSGWNIIRKILTTCTNCILANKVRNINSEISYSAKKSKDTRKFKKFESS